MNDSLAQAIALVGYGNDYLKTGMPDPRFNSLRLLDYCARIEFLGFKQSFIFTVPKIVAKTPQEWFEYLKSRQCKRLQLIYKARKRNDHMSAGFIDGAGIWTIKAQYGSKEEYWVAHWDYLHIDAPGGKCWNVKYEIQYNFFSAKYKPTGEESVKKELIDSLSEISEFAYQQDEPGWGGVFDDVKVVLESQTPYAGHYLENVVPKDNYTTAQLQILFGSFKAWVFSGMGSWSDICFEDEARYNLLTTRLYDAVIGGITHVLNSGGR